MTTESLASSVTSKPIRLMTVRSARQSLLVFAAFLIPLSVFGYWFYINNPDAPLTLPSLPLALSPGLAAILTRLVRREGFADVSFRLPGARLNSRRTVSGFLLALGLPFIVGGAAFGLAYALNLATFDPQPFAFTADSPGAQFALNLLLAITLGLLIVFPSTGGEEIGWRGYLLPRMIDARLPQPILLTSLIWGAWHLPVVFAGVYASGPNPLLSGLQLMAATALVGCIFGWIRLETGSVWPCILGHATWNAIMNGLFTPATHETTTRLWTGETGLLVILTLIPVTLLIWRFWRSKPAQL